MRHTDDTLTASYVNSNAICLAIAFPPIFFSSAGSVAANECPSRFQAFKAHVLHWLSLRVKFNDNRVANGKNKTL